LYVYFTFKKLKEIYFFIFKYGGDYLTFNAQTLIPFDKNLIDVSLLDKSEVFFD
jgi:hypothetical protein